MAKYNIIWNKILSREYGVQYTELSLKSLSPVCKPVVPKPFYEQVYIPENSNEACYINRKAWTAFVGSLKTKYVGNLNNYESFERMFMSTGNNYAGFAKKLASMNLSRKSNRGLKKLYLDYQQKSLKYAPFIWMQFIINNFFADKAKEIVSDKLGKNNRKIDEFYGIALRPRKKAAALQLADIALHWRGMTEKKKFEAYRRFQWIPCLDIHNSPWSKQEFYANIKNFKKAPKKSTLPYESVLKELRLSAKERKTMDIAKRLAYLKDLKDDFRREGVFFGQTFLSEIAKRMKIKLADLSYLLEDEILAFLTNSQSVPKQLIAKRKKGFVIYFDTKKNIVCKSGDDINAVLADLGLVVSGHFKEEIKGTPASIGRAKGIVAIVRGVADLSKVKKGYILIAVTTHPDYVPAMQKAAAIVTEEGGLTSHAAITARELGVPCIVGTKIATKFLKDGDLVEVDAKRGVVKKLEK